MTVRERWERESEREREREREREGGRRGEERRGEEREERRGERGEEREGGGERDYPQFVLPSCVLSSSLSCCLTTLFNPLIVQLNLIGQGMKRLVS